MQRSMTGRFVPGANGECGGKDDPLETGGRALHKLCDPYTRPRVVATLSLRASSLTFCGTLTLLNLAIRSRHACGPSTARWPRVGSSACWLSCRSLLAI